MFEMGIDPTKPTEEGPALDPQAYLERLARYGIGVRLVLGGLALSGPEFLREAARPFVARVKWSLMAWLQDHEPPSPRPFKPSTGATETESTMRGDPRRCCVCGESTACIVGDWGDAHPFCWRHYPLERLPFPFPVVAVGPLKDWQDETVERLAIIHDGGDCAALHSPKFTLVEASESGATHDGDTPPVVAASTSRANEPREAADATEQPHDAADAGRRARV